MKATGYNALVDFAGVSAIQHCRRSFISTANSKIIDHRDGLTTTTYPASYSKGNRFAHHLDFALRHEGINLQILSRVFKVVSPDEVVRYVQSRPTGQNTRRAWYLYELLTHQRLPLEDLSVGTYVDLLDHREYVTADPFASRRHRVNDNLLGGAAFCPMIRRTDRLNQALESDLSERACRVVEQYPLDILRRALAYLYTKESKSSFEIEHIKADASRTERFVAQLRLAETEDFFAKSRLIELQNRIVEPRYKDNDYRASQNYVGETVAWQSERIHFVSPRPADLSSLMDGMYACHGRMDESNIHPVVHAAIIAYGFVFMHPFEDGNGRIHRFLIHNILARRRFAADGVIFPVSAVMLKKPADYNASLEAFSKPLIPLIEYTLDDEGRMAVHNDTADYYRYIDFTAQAEALFAFIEETIETELVAEIRFILNYDRAKKAVQEIVDMPDRLIDLFIRFCLQNNGKLSESKRKAHFAVLQADEIERMEIAVRDGYAAT